METGGYGGARQVWATPRVLLATVLFPELLQAWGCQTACSRCLDDSSCLLTGERTYCVPMTFQGKAVGSYCLPKLQDNFGSCSRHAPYVHAISATSVGGESGIFCAPEPTTTCRAITGLNAPCGQASVDDQPAEASDRQCGHPAVLDALCVPEDPTASEVSLRCAPRCTQTLGCSLGYICVQPAEDRDPVCIRSAASRESSPWLAESLAR